MRMETKLGDWRKRAVDRLSGDRDEAVIAVNAIIKTTLNKDQVWLLTHLDISLNQSQLDQLEKYLTRLISDEPLPYILKQIEFFGLPFFVNANVLIPRPETEILVETVLNWSNEEGIKNKQLSLLDVGTGSGCIPISILKNTSSIYSAVSVDVSYSALQVAKKNLQLHNIKNLELFQGNLLTGIRGKFSIVTANLPYIPSGICKELRVAKNEPLLALDGGEDGLDLYRVFFRDLGNCLEDQAICICEIHNDQAEKISILADQNIKIKNKTIIEDYAGWDRFLFIEV